MHNTRTRFEQIPLEAIRGIVAELPDGKFTVLSPGEEKIVSETSPGSRTRCEIMTLPFDVFRVDDDGVRWLQSAATVDEAKAQISQAGGAGEYLLLNQITGNKIHLKVEEA